MEPPGLTASEPCVVSGPASRRLALSATPPSSSPKASENKVIYVKKASNLFGPLPSIRTHGTAHQALAMARC